MPLAVFRQFQWQQQHLSREEVAQAIADAEQMIADELLYWPAPKYFVDTPVEYPRPARRDLYGYGGTPRGEPKSVQLPWHHVVSGGLFNRTLIGTITALQQTIWMVMESKNLYGHHYRSGYRIDYRCQ
jgi:hypothetical protein